MAAMAKIEKRRLGDYGLKPRPGPAKRLALGFCVRPPHGDCDLRIAKVSQSTSTASVHFVMTPGAAWCAGLGWAGAFLLVAIAEESVFRGYAQFTLTQATGFWPAAIVISLLFGVTHITNTNYKAAGILSAGLLGLFSAFCLRRTGDLWLPIGIHAAFDWAEFFIFFAPSGGHESSSQPAKRNDVMGPDG